MRRVAIILAGLLLVCGTVPAAAEKQNFGLITSSVSSPHDVGDGQNYCVNFSDEAQEAQLAWRLKKIEELEAGLSKRMDALEKAKADVTRWMAKREAFLELARASLVEIYTRMRPDAAAQQLAALDDMMAAAILMKLKAKVASLILAEIEAERAAQLARVIAGAARTRRSGEGA